MEREIFRDSLRKFLEKEVAPLENWIQKNDDIPKDLFEKFGSYGFLGITVEERWGGGGAGFPFLTTLFEEVAYISPGVSASLLSHIALFILALDRFGTDEQKERFLVPAVKGDAIGAFAVTEEEAGSDVMAIRTRARKVKGGFILNGSKSFICNFSRSRFVITLARDEDGGFTFYVVEKGKGFVEGKKLEKLGLEGSDTGNFFLDNVFVPQENILGGKGKGIEVLSEVLKVSRIMTSSNCVGLALGALDRVKRFSKERCQFSRPLRDFQAYRLELSRCYQEVEVGRMLCERCAEEAERGLLSQKSSIVTKIYCTEMANRVTDRALHLMGAYGYSREYGVEKFLRASRAYTVGEGTTEILLEQLSRIENL